MGTSMSTARRLLGSGIAVAAVGAGTLTFAGAARADAEPVTFQLADAVIQPGESGRPIGPGGVLGRPNGTFVYAVSSKPLTDPNAQLQLPAGMSVNVGTGPTDSGCSAASTPGVYTCAVTSPGSFSAPLVGAADSAKDGTVAYFGAIYVPQGGNVADAVAKVKTVGSTPASPPGRTSATVTVESREHVAKNTVQLTTPDLTAGTSVDQQVKVHAVDSGKLRLFFQSAAGQPSWPFFPTPIGIKVTDVKGGPAGSCNHVSSDLNSPTIIAWCDLQAGDYTISYTLAAQPDVLDWKVDVRAEYDVLTWSDGNPVTHSTFGVQGGGPVPGTSPSPTDTPTPQPSTPTPTATDTSGTTAAAVSDTSTDAGGTGDSLASTGPSGLLPMAGGGLALIAGGAATLVALRRRRGAHSS